MDGALPMFALDILLKHANRKLQNVLQSFNETAVTANSKT